MPVPQQYRSDSRSIANTNITNRLVQQKDSAQLKIYKDEPKLEPFSALLALGSYDNGRQPITSIIGKRIRGSTTKYKIHQQSTQYLKEDLDYDKLINKFNQRQLLDKKVIRKETKLEKTPLRKRKRPIEEQLYRSRARVGIANKRDT